MKKQEIMKNTAEQRLIPFTDDLMFALVMRDTEICREFLRLILPEEFGEIKIASPEDPLFGEYEDAKNASVYQSEGGNQLTSEPQKTMKFVPDMHGVRLDVYIKSDKAWAEIEMQTGNDPHLGKRSRFYQSNMDLDCLEEGRDYHELKKSYVIFFCTFDPFHQDEPIYFFQNWDYEKGLKLDDFSYKLVINTKCSEAKVPDKLRPLFAYVNGAADCEGSDLVEKIDQRVKKFNTDDWRRKFMTFEHYVKEKAAQAYEEGAAKAQKEIAKKLKAAGMPSEAIAEYTGLTVEEVTQL